MFADFQFAKLLKRQKLKEIFFNLNKILYLCAISPNYIMSEQIMKKYKLALALGGSGARGFAHIGVLKFLDECGLRPDIIVGTNAGVLMGALYADGYKPDDLFNGREFSEFASLQIPKMGLFDKKPQSPQRREVGKRY